MAELGISVSGLYRQAEEMDKVGTSVLGNPVKSNIKFKELTYERRDGSTEELKDENVEGDHYLRLDTVIFQAQNVKEIKRTKVPGRDGTVTEYIGDGDYDITISGKLVNDEQDQRPEQLIRKIEDLCRANVPLDITSPFLNILGIDRIVVKSRRIEEEKGFANQLSFQIQAYAEETPIAEINEIQPANAQSLPSF